MDKNAIKKYAIWARNELIAKVSQKASAYGIEKDNIVDANADSIDGIMLSSVEKKQRKALIEQINDKGYEQVIEEVAYTWFNRFTAIRFMEVNGYLPSHIRVFTDDDNNFKPQILTEAIHLNDIFEKINMEKVLELKQEDKTEELYRYLLIIQCNSLYEYLPKMFQKIDDYTELLLPDLLLRQGSIIDELIKSIPYNYFDVNSEVGQVEIIGWLYQYYNTEQNELVYDGTLSKERIPKELLSAATTIYTPDWAVKYMVENSLGRLWSDLHKDNKVVSGWKYYLKQEEYINDSLIPLEQIKCLDPCAGSGHICCCLFDCLMDLYVDNGYSYKDAAKSIIKNNIWALDIEERAAQLAYFSLMMKGCYYDRRFLHKKIEPHVYAIKESNHIDRGIIDYVVDDDIKQKAIYEILDSMVDAKEYGSILDISKVTSINFEEIEDGIKNKNTIFSDFLIEDLKTIFQVVYTLNQKYDIVVTNPPYLGSNRFSPKLTEYVSKYYVNEKADLSMVMYKKALSSFVKSNGYVSFITTSSWMSLSNFQKLREYLLDNFDITSLVDFGTELFDGKVGHNPIVAWTVRKSNTKNQFTAIRLTDYCLSRRSEKENEYFNLSNYYYPYQDDIFDFPGCVISSYWADEAIVESFKTSKKLAEIAKPCVGLQTGENNKFIRLWFECDTNNIFFKARNIDEAKYSGAKWFPYNKGGEYRKWYGNNEYVVNWENDGYEIKHFYGKNGKLRSRPQNTDKYFKESVTWSKISSGNIAFRYKPYGHIFDVAGTSIFAQKELQKYILAFCNSTVALRIANILSPTLNYEVGHISSFPLIVCYEYLETINDLVEENIEICKNDWDSYETSWDFLQHPLIRGKGKISDFYKDWECECLQRRKRLKENEEKINEIFAKVYNLEGKISCQVNEKEISVNKADYSYDVKSLISYSIGCLFGRYSLDENGLICTNKDFDITRYKTIIPDMDGIIPICDDEYFTDDVVILFENFISTVFGKEYLTDNLAFIANALGKKGNPKEIIRKYFIDEFFIDHCSRYSGNVGRRPIYWLFDSGKKNGFKCLVYMNRYKSDTVARIRTDYVHEQQSRYRTAIIDLEKRINESPTAEKVKLNKRLIVIKEQEDELRVYEEKIHHLADQMIEIDLDDGVKENYSKLQDVLAKIK